MKGFNISVEQIKAFVSMMREQGVAKFQMGELVVEFSATGPMEKAKVAESAPVDVVPVKVAQVRDDGLTDAEAELAYAST